MVFRDFIAQTSVITDLMSTTKTGVLQEMVQHMVRLDLIPAEIEKSVCEALLQREELGTTGIGNGLAIPHAKHPGVHQLIGLFARSKAGVEYKALDGQKVQLFFLILSNRELTPQHLEALSYVSKKTRAEAFRRFLIRAHDAHEIHELFNEADANTGV